MKIVIISFMVLLLCVQKLNAQTSTPVTIVELFTSQGCSSCPSADLFLNKIVQEKGNEVAGLSFHVSYWNYLGWKDPYSSEQFTDRQKMYASIKKLNNIYTPQMIVDGHDEFVGSDKQSLSKSLDASKTRTQEYQIQAMALVEKELLKVVYSIQKDPNQEVLNFVMVEKVVENYVPRGENQGMKLQHFNVVRKFETHALAKSGEILIQLPSNFDRTKFGVVLFIQNKDLHVKGAVQIRL